jgi:type VI secretion system FHA domain protein
MPLTLKILSYNGQSFPATDVVVINDKGSIGRMEGNSLVLNDAEISRIHAIITEEMGLFSIKNQGQNGTFLNGYPLNLNSEPNILSNGDKLKIGTYEILVSIESDFGLKNDFLDKKPDVVDDIFSAMEAPQNSIQSFANPFDEWESFFDDFAKEDLTPQNPIFSNQPEIVTKPEFTAEKIEFTADTASANSSIKSPITHSDNLLFSFLTGAGVDASKLELEDNAQQTMVRIGQMFREMVGGTANLLRSRAEFKNLSRIDSTTIKVDGNNPLKFAPATDYLLKQLIENKEKGFVDSANAIEQAFKDIEHHQIAMQAGIQAALMDLLQSFNPKQVEKQFEHGLVLQKKSKCWDKYQEIYQQAVDNAVEDFYGEAFVEGYENQINASKRRR